MIDYKKIRKKLSKKLLRKKLYNPFYINEQLRDKYPNIYSLNRWRKSKSF